MSKEKKALGMVDVSDKKITKRQAVACAKIKMGKKVFAAFTVKGSPKGNVLETAKVAGIMAAKLTPRFIPLCHPLTLEKVNIDFEIDRKNSTVTARAEVICWGRTGVEMEALTAATVSALTIYDMMKWADKEMVIFDIMLLHKSGGRSGLYIRPCPPKR